MAIPTYDKLFAPIMEFLKDRGCINWRDIELPLAEVLGLTELEVALKYESGNGRIFNDRISWALSMLTRSGLLERPKRGHYQLNVAIGELPTDNQAFKEYVKSNYTPSAKVVKTTAGEAEVTSVEEGHSTPNAQIDDAIKTLREAEYEKLLSVILSKDARAFEKLVVELMEALGYGGFVANAGVVTQASNDGGIDGVIKEDKLGLGHIYLQAKRYKADSKISREAIQAFVGSLAVANSNKGVFITTSSFSKPARDYCDSLNGNPQLVLIDGNQLVQLIYDHGPGMQTQSVVTLRALDMDYWDEMGDLS